MKKIRNTTNLTFMHGDYVCKGKETITIKDEVADIWLSTKKFDLVEDDKKDKEIEALKKELEKAKGNKKSKKSKKSKEKASEEIVVEDEAKEEILVEE